MAGDPHADDVVVERGKALLFDLLLHMNATNDVLNDRCVRPIRMGATAVAH